MELELLKRDALILANARRMIKKKAITSNGRLYSDLFGTGMSTGRIRARNLGLDPDSNITSYNEMCNFIDSNYHENAKQQNKLQPTNLETDDRDQ